MQIVDAQIHLWGSGLPNNAAHRQVTSFTTDQALELMDEAQVNAAVIHPPSWDPGATQLALDAVHKYPARFAIMGHLPLVQAESAPKIARWRDQPGMLGLRYLLISETARQMLREGTLDWLWQAAETAQVPIALLATHCLDELGKVAQRYPQLRLTIDHLGGLGGNTRLKDHDAMAHMSELIALAQFDNVAVKATGAPGYSAQDYPYPIMQGYLRQIFDAFGPHRMFWGTDITKMPVSWRHCIEMFTDHLPWLHGHDRSLVMGQAVCDWWGWSRPGAES